MTAAAMNLFLKEVNQRHEDEFILMIRGGTSRHGPGPGVLDILETVRSITAFPWIDDNS